MVWWIPLAIAGAKATQEAVGKMAKSATNRAGENAAIAKRKQNVLAVGADQGQPGQMGATQMLQMLQALRARQQMQQQGLGQGIQQPGQMLQQVQQQETAPQYTLPTQQQQMTQQYPNDPNLIGVL